MQTTSLFELTPILPAKCVIFLLWQPTMICASWFSGVSTNRKTLKSQHPGEETFFSPFRPLWRLAKGR